MRGRARRGFGGLGGLRESLVSARLVVLDFRAGLYYVWRGGNVVCAIDRSTGGEAECWGMPRHDLEAARDFARLKIRQWASPTHEGWAEPGFRRR